MKMTLEEMMQMTAKQRDDLLCSGIAEGFCKAADHAEALLQMLENTDKIQTVFGDFADEELRLVIPDGRNAAELDAVSCRSSEAGTERCCRTVERNRVGLLGR